MLSYSSAACCGLALSLLSLPAWGAPPADDTPPPESIAGERSKPTDWVEEEERRKKEAWENKPWWGALNVGLHVVLPSPELRKTSDFVGAGLAVSAAFAPGNWPLLLGLDLGFDGFWPRTERFIHDGRDTYWDIKRRSIWLLPSLRLMPPRGKVRPYLGLLGGLWIHDVIIEPDSELYNDRRYNLGTDPVGAYGFAAGVAVVTGKHLGFGLGVKHLRGAGIKVPDQNDIAIQNGRLYVSEERGSGIHAWLVSLEMSGFL